MRKFLVVCLAVLCIVFLGGCGKKSAKENLAKCDDPVVLQMLKNQILESKLLCKDPKDELDLYCQIENGKFKNLKMTMQSGSYIGCYVEYAVVDTIGFVFDYEVQYENKKPISVSILDHDEAIGIR